MVVEEGTANTHHRSRFISAVKNPTNSFARLPRCEVSPAKSNSSSGPPEALRVIMSHDMTIDAGKQETASASGFQPSFSGAVTVIRPQDLNNLCITNPQEAIKPWERKWPSSVAIIGKLDNSGSQPRQKLEDETLTRLIIRCFLCRRSLRTLRAPLRWIWVRQYSLSGVLSAIPTRHAHAANSELQLFEILQCPAIAGPEDMVLVTAVVIRWVQGSCISRIILLFQRRPVLQNAVDGSYSVTSHIL
jgi:hypothetical protein